jgi:hypothetical protein
MSYDISFTTVASGPFLALAPFFIRSIRDWHRNIPVYLLVSPLEGQKARRFLNLSKISDKVEYLEIPDVDGLPSDPVIQVCAKKLAIWTWLPSNVERTILVDINTVVIGDLIGALDQELISGSKLCLTLDNTLGLQNIIGFNRNSSPQFDLYSRRKYCNTGLIICSRKYNLFFEAVLDQYRLFFEHAKQTQSFWHQNIFNYCLDTGEFNCTWNDVHILDKRFNILKEYDVVIDLDHSMISVSGEQALLLHFNVEDLVTKIALRARAVQLLIR